jgi:hypothetical protein
MTMPSVADQNCSAPGCRTLTFRASAGLFQVLGVPADDTVPSRLYFHCGDFIVALIDWAIEAHGEHRPFHPLPDNLYFATD